jgi:hypothetical protein
VFDKFPKYHMKMLLGDFNAKVGKVNISKPTVGNESLHEISNDNGTSPCGKPHNRIVHILIERRRHSSALDVRSIRAADCDTGNS